MRKIYKVIIYVMIIIILTVLYARFIGTSFLKVKEYPIYSDSVPNDFDGIKIIHFSDLHYKRAITREKIDKIVDENGTITYQGERQVVKKVYSNETVSKMHEIMKKVVEINKYWQVDNVSLMGKTGTAQIASPKGGYLTGTYDYIKSFAGIFPTDNPKYIVYVAGKKPESSLGSWAKVITTAVEEIASYAKLTESKSDADLTKIIKLDNYISTNLETTLEELKNKKINIITIGNGKYIINQYPLKNKTLLSGEKLFILTNATEYKMENLTGWSIGEVKTYCDILGLKLEYSGYGYVKSQSIEAGAVLDLENMILTVELEKTT